MRRCDVRRHLVNHEGFKPEGFQLDEFGGSHFIALDVCRAKEKVPILALKGLHNVTEWDVQKSRGSVV